MELRAYEKLCTAPEDEAPWPPLNGGTDAPGSFVRGWKRFWQTNIHYQAIQNLGRRYPSGTRQKWKRNWTRQIDRDVQIPEQPLCIEGADEACWCGEAQGERFEDNKAAALRQNIDLEQHFNKADLEEIVELKLSLNME